MSVTSTHTHTIERFANPYLRCTTCDQPVEGYIADECSHQGELIPCRHLGTTSICPSWGPVDGCRCQEQLGSVPQEPRLGVGLVAVEADLDFDLVPAVHGGEPESIPDGPMSDEQWEAAKQAIATIIDTHDQARRS